MSEPNTVTETDMQTDTGLVPVSERQLDQINNSGLPMPTNREQAELVREMMEAEAAIEAMTLDGIQSKLLCGIPLTVVDAVFTDIKDKDVEGGFKKCVRFLVIREDTGEKISCLKGSNTFNDTYVNFFNKWRGYNRELPNMEFFEDERWKKAGNPAIVLRKIKPVEKAVGKR